MKFSLLIPTRNRLDLLKYAISSVLKQNFQDWEIVISDNASSENIKDYVHSLNEPRIKYSRSEEFLSITQNWNRCIDLCTGDYAIMIGDDDILLKNYFQIVSNLIDNFENPDLIYTNAFLYAYPGVLPHFPKGVFQSFGSLYGMPKHTQPFWLDQSCKRALIQKTLEFGSIYSTNMQHALISRPLLEKVKREDKFFHSPYPDIYAMSALFHESDRILIYPKELVVIGISPKSHGCYAINRKEKEAVDLLNIKNEMSEIPSLQSVLLPGFIVFTFWLGAIELFKLHFPLQKHKLKLDYKIYRKNQIDYILYYFLTDKKKFSPQFNELMKRLTFSEKILFIFLPRATAFLKKAYNFLEKIFPDFLQRTCRGLMKWMQSPPPQPAYTPLNPPPGYLMPNMEPNRFSTILEIYEQVEPVDLSR